MFRHSSYCCPGMYKLLLHGLKIIAIAVSAMAMTACDDDSDSPEPEPAAGFKLHIGETNIVELDMSAPDYYPPMYQIVMVMEDLPADEKIIYMGGVYSTDNPEPDIDDCTLIYDYSEEDLIQSWDWEKEPLYWRCMLLFHPIPDTTYYVRGYVQTDKGEYYTNTYELRSRSTTSAASGNSGAYEIPVIYHLFPDESGFYPVKEWLVREQIEYANLVFSNYYNIPGQADAGVRFVAATHAPDGTPLTTPGIVYEKEAVNINYYEPELDDKYIWDMEYALNVWVCPIYNGEIFEDEFHQLAGFSYYPFFDADEMLEGCNLYEPDLSSGIFLNPNTLIVANNAISFAHEAGHFLSLEHVFAPDGDYCDDTPWYDYTAHWQDTQGDIVVTRTSDKGEQFWSDNIMDYEYGFMTGLTPEQVKRIRYTLQHAYHIPGPAGKAASPARASAGSRRFSGKPVS